MESNRSTDSAAAPVAGRTSGWVVVDADAHDRDWSASTIHADYEDADAERQEILGGGGGGSGSGVGGGGGGGGGPRWCPHRGQLPGSRPMPVEGTMKHYLRWELEQIEEPRVYRLASGSAVLVAVMIAALVILGGVGYILIDRWLLW